METKSFDPQSGEIADLVKFKTSQGIEICASLLRLSAESVTFSYTAPGYSLRISEIINQFDLLCNRRQIYSGKATVCKLLETGTGLMVEVKLAGPRLAIGLFREEDPKLGAESICSRFVSGWEKNYKILPEYKLVIADLESFLHDLRHWLDQFELAYCHATAETRDLIERSIIKELSIHPVICSLFERFERIAELIPMEFESQHRAFGQRQIHPYLLSAPFIYRSFAKPLGYAGDYEMMNMMVRNRNDGESLFAKVINAHLLAQPGPQAVRNRVGFLQGKIVNEVNRLAQAGRIANVFCIACGPAWEVQNFIAETPLADYARFTMLDFDEETVNYTGRQLDNLRREYSRRTQVRMVKDAVQNLLRDRNTWSSIDRNFDLIYCSGLYDYLNDRIVKALNTCLYDRLNPEGLLVVGNFAPSTPVRNFIEHFMEWFLIYRDSKQLARLAPEQADKRDCQVSSEMTGANIFLEVRKAR